MSKLNPLPPHLRENQRYIVFEIISKSKFTKKDIINHIWKKMIRLFGDVGSAEFNVWIPLNLLDENTKKGVIKTNSTSVEKIRLALASINEINGNRVIFKIHGVSGTIKSAKNKYLNQENLLKYQE